MSIISSSPCDPSSSVTSSPPPSGSTNTPPCISPGLQHLEQLRLHQLYTLALADRMRFLTHHQQHLNTGGPFLSYSPKGPSSPGAASPSQAGEDPKPQQSYIGLISMAILSSKEHKLVLADIYQYILDNYAYFRHRGPGWRNSIRHNLSLNDCFIKAGRAANGKGHYWAIHPACKDDFSRGDYRRRKAQRKVRRHMGLSVEEEDSPSPPPPPAVVPPPATVATGVSPPSNNNASGFLSPPHWALFPPPILPPPAVTEGLFGPPRKRQFDVASLLRPKSPLLLEEAGSSKRPFLPWLLDQGNNNPSSSPSQEYFTKYYQSLLASSPPMPASEEDIAEDHEGRLAKEDE